MGTRVLHAFGSGVCEALPVQLVNDIFFLHERGKRIGYYTGIISQSQHSSEIKADNIKSVSVLVQLVLFMLVTC
jgi:hypothetical protein